MNYPKAFITANVFTQKWEKGFVNHPNDPGGITFNGVSLRFLKQTGIDVNGDGHIDAKDIRALYERNDQATVDLIFYNAFWRDTKLERLPYLVVQIVYYDSAVNTGRTQTAKFLQRGCNSLVSKKLRLVDDGVVGPKTESLVHALCRDGQTQELGQKMADARLAFHNLLVNSSPYPDGRNYRPFAAGWRNRVNNLKTYIKAFKD